MSRSQDFLWESAVDVVSPDLYSFRDPNDGRGMHPSGFYCLGGIAVLSEQRRPYPPVRGHVLLGAAIGLSDQEIAERLELLEVHMTWKAVSGVLARIRDNLGAGTRSAVLPAAISHDVMVIVEPAPASKFDLQGERLGYVTALAEGKDQAQIAKMSGVSPQTVSERLTDLKPLVCPANSERDYKDVGVAALVTAAVMTEQIGPKSLSKTYA